MGLFEFLKCVVNHQFHPVGVQLGRRVFYVLVHCPRRPRMDTMVGKEWAYLRSGGFGIVGCKLG